jgi:hypothetical protein
MVILFSTVFISCQKELAEDVVATGNANIQFKHKAGTADFQLLANYQNNSGESFTINNFKYYVTNIELEDSAGVFHKVPASYFLVDEKNIASKLLSFKTAEGKYIGLRFLLGVDSAKNVSGTQTGALDPTNGMFWTWNTGYISAMLEGNSPVSQQAANMFTYHVGGFKTGENATRTITLNFDSTPLVISSSATSEIDIEANILKWFDGATTLKIAESQICHSPGTLAMKIADNFSTMFTLSAIKNN